MNQIARANLHTPGSILEPVQQAGVLPSALLGLVKPSILERHRLQLFVFQLCHVGNGG